MSSGSGSSSESEAIRHLYTHVPFCAKGCPYWPFHVHRGGRAAQTRFVDAMLREWELIRSAYNCSFETIYFGGGTPSILAPEDFTRLSSALCTALARDVPGAGPEVTLEVNPAT